MYLKTKNRKQIEKHLNNILEMLDTTNDLEIVKVYITDYLLEEDEENNAEIVFECFYDEEGDL